MPITQARSLQSLYDAVADYDVVIVPDNPLADAINRRVETPQFGTFATTPRRLASGRREQAEDRRAFLEVIERTDQPWKATAYAIGNVLQCWEHRGSLEGIYDYGAYVDEATERVVEIMADLDTTSRRLSEYTVDPDRSVAVLGGDQFTELERSILPAEYDGIDLFTDQAFDHPPFHVFESTADVVNALLDTIDSGTAGDVAIVLDRGSRYSSLVESALDAASIPYYGGPGFVDDPDHRAVLGLFRTAYRGTTTRVADVRAIAARAGDEIAVDHDEKRLDEADVPELAWIASFCENAAAHTFHDAIDVYESATGRSLDQFRAELSELGLATEPLDRSRVEDLAYYLETYEVPVDRENEGVLLADAGTSGYVDRPVVFYLGMDEGWTHSPPQRPWVDAEAQFDRHIREFQRLLQSGTEQYYLVQDTAGGQPVTPCLYLGELLAEDFERFGDLESVWHTRPRNDGTGGFEKAAVDVDPTARETISQSGLNSYVNSPRDYFFGQLLDGPDRDYFREGNLFHDFAEFYAIHPEAIDSGGSGHETIEDGTSEHGAIDEGTSEHGAIDEGTREHGASDEGTIANAASDRGTIEGVEENDDAGGISDGEGTIEEVVEVMVEAVKPFYHDGDEPLRRRKYRIGLETIVEYLDEHPPTDHDFLTGSSGWGENVFAEYFDRPVDSPLTERWFEDTDLGVKGKIDLVRAADHLVDHKSGRKKSEYKVVDAASVDPPAQTPNFQAALYLSYVRTQQPDTPIEFTFFHFLETMDEVITGEADLDDAITSVTYHPTSFEEFVASREAYEHLLDGYTDCVETFEDLGFETYREIASDLDFPETTDRDELQESDFAADFTVAVAAATGDVDAEKGVDQAIRKLDSVRRRAFFREDLDEFEDFLEECLADINHYRGGNDRFPIEGPGGEPNYRRVDHRDLFLEGSGDV